MAEQTNRAVLEVLSEFLVIEVGRTVRRRFATFCTASLIEG
jgi:hypothetical protein